MDLEETLLPGVGVRYRLRTRSGEVLAVVLAGPAVAAGIPQLGPVATGYVLVLAVAGPVLTRFAEPRVGPVPSAASP